MRRASKYKAKRTQVDGIVFHSQKEARRYQELKLLERACRIRNLELQPRFPLSVKDPHAGESKFIGAYRGDFRYEEFIGNGDPHLSIRSEYWRPIVEDVKGFKTPLYRWKKKHVEAQYGIEIREV